MRLGRMLFGVFVVMIAMSMLFGGFFPLVGGLVRLALIVLLVSYLVKGIRRHSVPGIILPLLGLGMLLRPILWSMGFVIGPLSLLGAVILGGIGLSILFRRRYFARY